MQTDNTKFAFGVIISILTLAFGVFYYFQNVKDQRAAFEKAYAEFDDVRDRKLKAQTWLDRSIKSYESGNLDRAAEQRQKSEDLNSDPILIKLADAYTSGIGAPKSLEDAERLYQRIGGKRYSYWVIENAQKLMLAKEKEHQDRGIELFERAVEFGDELSTKTLARYYEYGNFVEKSFDKAAALHQKLGQAEYAGFLGRTGRKMTSGFSTHEEQRKGFDYLTQAAELGNEHANLAIARSYMGGLGVKQDQDKALEVYAELSESADDRIKFEVAKEFLRRSNRRENPKGVALMEQLIESDYEAAKTALANFYFNNTWSDRSFEKAARYFLLSKHLNPDETVNLGHLYRLGYGVTQDHKKAIELYSKATREYPHTAANLALGHMYRLGLGVDVDFKMAIDYYDKAGRFTNGEAAYNIGRIHAQGIDGQPDLKESVYFFEKAIEKEDAEAYAALARMYEKGMGVEQSESKAFELMRESGLLGSTAGRLGTAEYYARGFGCEKSEKTSKQWRSKLDNDPLAFE